MSTPTYWNLEEVITVIRELEKKFSAVGWHCGLTGSVLYKGSSTKDFDLIVYPHNTTEQEEIVPHLESFGFSEI